MACKMKLFIKLSVFLVLKKHGVSRADMLLVVVVAHNLYVVETKLDFDPFIGRAEETQSVEGEFKLGTDADEDAAFGFDAILPTELQCQDVLVLVWLEGTQKSTCQTYNKYIYFEPRKLMYII